MQRILKITNETKHFMSLISLERIYVSLQRTLWKAFYETFMTPNMEPYAHYPGSLWSIYEARPRASWKSIPPVQPLWNLYETQLGAPQFPDRLQYQIQDAQYQLR